MKHVIKNRIFFLIVCILTAFVCPFPACAQDVSFQAQVNATRIPMNASVRLTLSVIGTQAVDKIALPKIEGFDSQYVGPSTKVSIINGQMSSIKSFVYVLYPKRVGVFTIPAFSADIEGNKYTTQSITIEVVDSSQSAGGSPAAGGSQETTLEDKIFLVLSVDKRDVFVNEKIALTVRLFVRGLSIRYSPEIELEHAGFTLEDFDDPRQYRQDIGGVTHDVIEFNTVMYPTRSGELKLGPAMMNTEIRYQKSGRRDSFFGGSLFDDDFFGGMFGSVELRPYQVRSSDIGVTVRQLPQEDKPRDFSDGVGRFDFKVTATPNEVAVGDPITIRMEVSGHGNLKPIHMPAFKETRAYKVYDPNIKEEGGSKILEQVVIPTTDTLQQLPRITFSYFDVAQKRYVSVAQGPFPITVRKSENGDNFKIIGVPRGNEYAPKEEFGSDIVFIKGHPGFIIPVGYRLYKQPWFLILVLASAGLWLVAFWFLNRKERLRNDVRFANRLKAPRQARQGLKSAAALLKKSDDKEFYDVIFKTLQEYLGKKFHVPVGSVNHTTIKRVVDERNLDVDICTLADEVFEECDAVRFASARIDTDAMTGSYRKAEKIIDYFERKCK